MQSVLNRLVASVWEK